MVSDPLLAALCDAAPPAVRDRVVDEPELAEMLRRLVAEAQQAHPDLAIDGAVLAAKLGAGLTDDGATPIAAAIAAICTPDLYLAIGCEKGLASALRSFMRTYQGDIDRAAAKCGSAGMSPGEFTALVQDRLFVEPQRIARYTGKGDLRGWLRVVLSRLVVDVLRRAAAGPLERPADPDDLLHVADAHDPELGLLHAQYREPVRAALERAFARLSPRERNLLRLRLLEGWNHDQLGARFGVHRTSAARWIVQAQQALFEATRAELHAELGVAQREFESLARAVQSRLHLSVQRILSRTLEPETPE